MTDKELIQALKGTEARSKRALLDEAANLNSSMSAADVAPVVHARWLKHYRSGVTVAEGCVSSCCDMWNERESHYCPHCGARMDGGADNGK